MTTTVQQRDDAAAAPAATAGAAPASRWLWAVAAVLIVGQLAFRGWALSRNWFYWDDFIFTGRAASFPLFSADFLLHDQDGHFMPAGFLIAGLVTRWAPLEWAPAAASLLVLQAVASVAVLRLLRQLVGRRWVLLVPLAFYLLCPLTLPADSWWASALNAIPLQAALAWLAADVLLFARTGRTRWLVSAGLGFAVALTFSERSVLAVPVAYLVLVLVMRADGEPSPWRAAWAKARPIWRTAIAITAAWAVVYAGSVSQQLGFGGVQGPVRTAVRGIVEGVVPTVLGGPWRWDQLPPSTPLSATPLLMVAASVLVVGLLVRESMAGRPGARAAWALGGGYLLVSALLAALGRTPPGAPTVVGLTLRWFADATVVLAIALALVLRSPRSGVRPAAPWARRLRPAALGLAAVVFVAGSLWSSVAFIRANEPSLHEDYVTTAAAELAAHAGTPMLDQPVPEEVLSRLTTPNNLVSHFFAPVEPRPDIVQWTDDLQVLDDSGRIVPGAVTADRNVAWGPLPDCGYRVAGTDPTPVALDGPLLDTDWTVQLNYAADRDGVLTASLGGEAVSVDVQRGYRTVYLHLTGGGQAVQVTNETPGLTLCVTSGVVGQLAPR